MGHVVSLRMKSDDFKPKTKDIKPRSGEVIKPAEIIGIRGAEHWTLHDRLVWAALLRWAWGDRLEDPAADFIVPMAELRGMITEEAKAGHDSFDRIKESVITIMRTVVQAATPNRPNSTRLVGLLSGLDIDHNIRDGVLTYSFDKRLIPILRNSDVYARLDLKVMAAFTSKYSAALYEQIALMGGLKYKQSERMTLGRFRQWLSIPDGKMERWPDLRRKAIEPGVHEINEISPFKIAVRPIKRGRAITHVEVTWEKKVPLSPEEQRAVREVNRTKVGRKARISGSVEVIAHRDGFTTSDAKAVLRERGLDGYSIYAVQADWMNHVRQMEFRPEDLNAHFLAYCQAWTPKQS